MYEQFAGYELITLVADGVTGRVHLAQDPATGQLFAIKEMILERESALPDEEQRQRFEREVRIHCSLDHPNIVKAHSGGVWEGRHYLVLDYQPGTTLQAMMEAGRPSMVQVIEWGIQLCSALDYLYNERQLVHRDIKPANLIISPSGQVQMTDFGLARVALHPEITQTKMMLGTIVYMSPEQLLDPTMVDNRADIFAVGVVLFKALTGALPFAADDITGMAHRLLYDRPSDPREFNPLLPEGLAKVLLRCLAKDVDERYVSAGQLSFDLEQVLRDPAIHLAQGKLHAERARWQDAAHCFQQAAALDAVGAEAWFCLGDALERLEQVDPAFDCYLKAIHSDPANVSAYRRLGRAYARRGQPEAASRMIERAWTLAPEDLATCLDLVALRRELGRLMEAAEIASDTVLRHPESSRAHLELGRLLYGQGRTREALLEFEEAQRLDPMDYQVLFNLGALRFELGGLGEAEDLFLKAIAVDSSRPEAQHNLAVLWVGQGRHEEARDMLSALLSRRPSASGFSLLGEVLLALGRAPEAIAAFQQAEAIEPSWSGKARLAEGLVRCFRYQEALATLRAAVAEAPPGDRSQLHIMYAHVAATAGNPGEAAGALQACLAEKPSEELAALAEDLLGRLQSRLEPEARGKSGTGLRALLGRGLLAAR